jgi:hypothetical protein
MNSSFGNCGRGRFSTKNDTQLLNSDPSTSKPKEFRFLTADSDPILPWYSSWLGLTDSCLGSDLPDPRKKVLI